VDHRPRGTYLCVRVVYSGVSDHLILTMSCTSYVRAGRRVVREHEGVHVPQGEPPWIVESHGQTDVLRGHHELQPCRQPWYTYIHST
jgi:hypothetical protein